jgi:hypothetical protein
MEDQKQEKKAEQPQINFRKEFNQVIQKTREDNADQAAFAVKVVLISGAAIGAIWASKYALLALAGTIRAFRELRKSIRE